MIASRIIAVALAALMTAVFPAQAQSHPGGFHGGGAHGGSFQGGPHVGGIHNGGFRGGFHGGGVPGGNFHNGFHRDGVPGGNFHRGFPDRRFPGAHFHHGHPGRFFGGVGVGIVLVDGFYSAPLWYPYPVASVVGVPQPIFYAREGQSSAQAAADLAQCNQWAADQPDAMNDANELLRATLACMDARGYSAR